MVHSFECVYVCIHPSFSDCPLKNSNVSPSVLKKPCGHCLSKLCSPDSFYFHLVNYCFDCSGHFVLCSVLSGRWACVINRTSLFVLDFLFDCLYIQNWRLVISLRLLRRLRWLLFCFSWTRNVKLTSAFVEISSSLSDHPLCCPNSSLLKVELIWSVGKKTFWILD